ncbi:MAG: DUF3320 domain-containing protein [Solobacterium sp.]|nr:DUF3320 domain-containing protein [Solobacterium sp.]
MKPVKKKYIPSSLPFRNMGYEALLKGDHSRLLSQRIRQVIAEEAPVSDRLLRRRVLNSLGIYRSGSAVTMVMDAVMESMDFFDSEEGTDRFFWKDAKQRTSYAQYRVSAPDDEEKRDILDISCMEIANAAAAVLQQGKMREEELLRETALCLGYTRIGSNVRRKVTQAIQSGIASGKFSVKNGSYML